MRMKERVRGAGRQILGWPVARFENEYMRGKEKDRRRERERERDREREREKSTQKHQGSYGGI